LSAAVITIVFIPWPGDWPLRPVRTLLKPLPARPPSSEGDLPLEAYTKAMRFVLENRALFSNKRYITIIDYTLPSTNRRLFLIDMESGTVERHLVSHGKNSGWLYARRFSNRPQSFESPRGFFRTGRKYYGRHGPALELNGLQAGINDNTACRGIVLHGAGYAGWGAVLANNGARLGRSLGCPAVPAEVAESVIDRIKGGSLLYIYVKDKD
jgi:hypothetical protein